MIDKLKRLATTHNCCLSAFQEYQWANRFKTPQKIYLELLMSGKMTIFAHGYIFIIFAKVLPDSNKSYTYFSIGILNKVLISIS